MYLASLQTADLRVTKNKQTNGNEIHTSANKGTRQLTGLPSAPGIPSEPGTPSLPYGTKNK